MQILDPKKEGFIKTIEDSVAYTKHMDEEELKKFIQQ